MHHLFQTLENVYFPSKIYTSHSLTLKCFNTFQAIIKGLFTLIMLVTLRNINLHLNEECNLNMVQYMILFNEEKKNSNKNN